jgi:hypothetical protein
MTTPPGLPIRAMDAFQRPWSRPMARVTGAALDAPALSKALTCFGMPWRRDGPSKPSLGTLDDAETGEDASATSCRSALGLPLAVDCPTGDDVHVAQGPAAPLARRSSRRGSAGRRAAIFHAALLRMLAIS